MANSNELIQKSKTKQRNASIEFLRILSMLLIIFLHSIDHSGVLEASKTSSMITYYYVQFTYMMTQVCVNLYVLISGYFLVKSKFNLCKLIILWLEVVFYSLVIRLVFIAFGYQPFSVESILSCLVPVITGRYWFITIYFGLYLIFPFINILINSMNKKQHTILCVVMFLLSSVMVSLHPSLKGMNSGAGWGLAWFVVLYIMASWFRLYYTPNYKWICKILLWVGISLIVTILMGVGDRIPIVGNIASNMYRYDSVPALFSSLCIFSAFLNIRIKKYSIFSRIILFIAPSTLGVYLIHAHANFSPWLWEFLNLPSYMDSYLFPFIQIGAVVGIFVFCIIIDIIRRCTIARIEKSKIIFIVSKKITLLVDRLFLKIASK